MSVCRVSALCIDAYLSLRRSRIPRPFAMCRAFSGSDYYGLSVTMRLAPCRSSRVFSQSDVQRAFAVCFRPLSSSLLALHLGELPGGITDPPVLLPAGNPCWLSRMYPITGVLRAAKVLPGADLHSTFPVSRFSAGLAESPYPTHLRASPLSRHALFPFGFPFRVRRVS